MKFVIRMIEFMNKYKNLFMKLKNENFKDQSYSIFFLEFFSQQKRIKAFLIKSSYCVKPKF